MEKQYFIRIDRWYYPKNNLETAIIEKVKKDFNNVLIDESDLKKFEDDLKAAIASLNQYYKRAKPLLFRGWRSNNRLYIRRDTAEGIDDLVILEAVEVARVFGKEGGEGSNAN